jgi:hypothetical protein
MVLAPDAPIIAAIADGSRAIIALQTRHTRHTSHIGWFSHEGFRHAVQLVENP